MATFLNDTFSKSNATKKQCLKESNGVLDGYFQISYRKDSRPHGVAPWRNEYTGEVLNITYNDWDVPPSPKSVDPNFFNYFLLRIFYRSLKFSERAVNSKCPTCVGEDKLIPWVMV